MNCFLEPMFACFISLTLDSKTINNNEVIEIYWQIIGFIWIGSIAKRVSEKPIVFVSDIDQPKGYSHLDSVDY